MARAAYTGWFWGDRWNNYCMKGWDGEKLKEGERRTTREDFEELLRSLAVACGDGSR
jgi:hypothetical protein